MGVLDGGNNIQKINGVTIGEGLLKELLMRVGIQWYKYCDVFPRKLINFTIALPEYDYMGLNTQGASTLSNIIFGGSGFKIKCRKGIPNMGGSQTALTPNKDGIKENPLPAGTTTLNYLIESEIFGRLAFKENLRRHFYECVILGNMMTDVGRDVKGRIEIQYINALSSYVIEHTEHSVDKVACIKFRQIAEEESIAFVSISDQWTKQWQLYKITGGTTITGRIQWGTPEWYEAWGGELVEEVSPFPIIDLTFKNFQWWRMPTEDVRHISTPYTNGLMWNYAIYREVLKCYMNLKKEFGYKLPILFYNKSFDSTRPLDAFAPMINNLQNQNPKVWLPPRTDAFALNFLNFNQNNGIWPNSDSFPNFSQLYFGLMKDYSPNSIKDKGSDDCWVKTLMTKDQLLDKWDPPIRWNDFYAHLRFELGRLGKTQGLGANFYALEDINQQATQRLMGDRDLLNFVTQIENYMERPIKELVLACCAFWVQDGLINEIDIPGSMDEIEITWDNSILMDINADKERFLMGYQTGLLSREFILRKVYGLTEEEIQKNLIELLNNPMLTMEQSQIQQQNDVNQHLMGRRYGVLGATPIKPIGSNQESSLPQQGQKGNGTVGGRISGNEAK